VLPSALGMGAMFPLTMRVWSAGGTRVGREVATVYAGNTLGSIAGAWLPGFVLMPTFGMQPTLHAGIAVNLLLALYVLLAAGELAGGARALRVALVPATAGLCALLYVASAQSSPLAWNLTKMTLGVFRISLAKDMLDGETWGEPTWSSTATDSPPRSRSSAGADTTRSRTTARSRPATATTCRRRSWSPRCRSCSTRAARAGWMRRSSGSARA
jgi:hypothetical protein